MVCKPASEISLDTFSNHLTSGFSASRTVRSVFKTLNVFWDFFFLITQLMLFYNSSSNWLRYISVFSNFLYQHIFASFFYKQNLVHIIWSISSLYCQMRIHNNLCWLRWDLFSRSIFFSPICILHQCVDILYLICYYLVNLFFSVIFLLCYLTNLWMSLDSRCWRTRMTGRIFHLIYSETLI